MRGDKKLIMKLGIFSAFFTFAHFMYIPYLAPLIEAALKGQQLLFPVEVWLSIIFAVYPLTIIFAVHGLGALSDEIGRRRVMLLGLLFCIADLALYIFTSSPWLFIFAKVLEAAGYNAFLLVLLAKVNDYIHDKERGSQDGQYLSFSQAGNMLGPIVGSFLTAAFFPKLPFISALIIMCFMFIYLYSTKDIKVKRTHAHSFDLIKNLKTFLHFRKLKGMAILGIAMHTHAPVLILFLPLYINALFPGRPEYIGLALFCASALKPLQFLAGKVVDKQGKARITVLGCIVTMLALFLIPLADSAAHIFGIMLLYSLGGACWNVGAWTVISDIGEANHIEGHVAGSYASIAKVGDFVATLSFGVVAAAFGYAMVFSIAGFVTAFGVVLSLFFLRDLPQKN